MTNQRADFEVNGGGTVYLLFPLNADAKAHLESNVGESATWLGSGLAVEHRYIVPLVQALRVEGYSVR